MFRRRGLEEGGAGDLERPPAEALLAGGDQGREIPYAVRWLVPKGERFANFDILNDNDTQLDYYRRHGHIYAVGIPTKKWRLVVVSDPELLDEVAANEEQFGKPIEELNFFAQLQHSRGEGLSVIGDGEKYERIRRVMLPWYSPSNQKTQFPRMKDQALQLVQAWEGLEDTEPIDARAWMEYYTLEVSGRGACNYDFGLLRGDGSHAFAQAVPASTKESILRVAEPRPDFTLLAGRAKRARRESYRRQNEELFRTAEMLVRGRMHTCPTGGAQTDLLGRMITTPDPDTGEFLSIPTMRDQVLMHMSNGFNGPSITAAWLIYLVATHPEVEEKLLTEIDSVCGGDPDYEMQYEDLMNLPYLTQVIKETLRIYPPMPVTIRRSLQDGKLGDYRIRKHDVILVGALAAQRDPRYWGEEADRFDPEQFAMERVVDRPRHAFIPFSVGKRQCMAQEVTFMMLRVVLFEIYKRYRLRLAADATVIKNTVVTTKPAAVPVVRLPRATSGMSTAPSVAERLAAAPVALARQGWGSPTEIPETSTYRNVVIAYGSNFGTNKELAQRFAERAHYYGYTCDLMTLNELADSPPRTSPWLLVVMTSTYTSNPPSNATNFKAWLERCEPGAEPWRECRYIVWGLGNSQWNAFLAYPRHVHARLAELGATPLADLGYADVGTPAWEGVHADWNTRIWPDLLKLSDARVTESANARVAAERASTGALTGSDSNTAMTRSLHGDAAPRVLLSPKIFTNAVGIETISAKAVVCRELQAEESSKRTRHLEIVLPPGASYRAGDHLAVCPKNDEERVERVAEHLGAVLEGLFMVPKTMDVSAVPKGVVLQVRNVLTNLVDITGRPTVALVDLLLEKATDPDERHRLAEIRAVMQTPDGATSSLRTAVDAGGFDLLRLLDEFPSCTLNVFEFLRVAQPLRPRYYSTCSSPAVHGELAHVAVGLEEKQVPDMPGRTFRGMSAHYVHSLRPGDRLNVFLDSAEGFHLQEDVSKPMILVSAGTGFAPMRAFLWERVAMQKAGLTLGEAVLINGIRSRDLDFIYRDEIEQFAADRVLDHVHIVASRESTCPEHVQDRIQIEGELIWRLLSAGGYVYVCGSQQMRDSVRDAFIDVIAAQGGHSREHAVATLHELEASGRYRPDLWG